MKREYRGSRRQPTHPTNMAVCVLSVIFKIRLLFPAAKVKSRMIRKAPAVGRFHGKENHSPVKVPFLSRVFRWRDTSLWQRSRAKDVEKVGEIRP
jgi:hypothetical protein